MRWLLVAALAYGCLLIERTVFWSGGLAIHVDEHWARPDIVLVAGLFLAFFFKPLPVFIAGWCLGMSSDFAYLAGPLGLKALLFCLVLSAISAIRFKIPRTRILVQFASALALVFAVHWVWYVAARLAAGAGLWPVRSAEEAILDALYSAVLAPYLFMAFLTLRGPLRIAVPSNI